jgi:hypothetical protein
VALAADNLCFAELLHSAQLPWHCSSTRQCCVRGSWCICIAVPGRLGICSAAELHARTQRYWAYKRSTVCSTLQLVICAKWPPPWRSFGVHNNSMSCPLSNQTSCNHGKGSVRSCADASYVICWMHATPLAERRRYHTPTRFSTNSVISQPCCNCRPPPSCNATFPATFCAGSSSTRTSSSLMSATATASGLSPAHKNTGRPSGRVTASPSHTRWVLVVGFDAFASTAAATTCSSIQRRGSSNKHSRQVHDM